MQFILDNYNYWISVALMMAGFYGVINSGNFVKKVMGLAIFQTSVLLFYISLSHIEGGAVPILKDDVVFYVNPLPHVLMLTAIVVGVATMAVGLAIIVRIREEYGTIEEDEILTLDAMNKPVAKTQSASAGTRRKKRKRRQKKRGGKR